MVPSPEQMVGRLEPIREGALDVGGRTGRRMGDSETRGGLGLRLVALAVVLALSAACSANGEGSEASGSATSHLDAAEVGTTGADPTTSSTAGTEAEVETGPSRAETLLAELTVEQKVGQLFMPLVTGSDANQVSAEEAANNQAVFGYGTPGEIVTAFNLGGVIYLENNIVAADQVGTFSAGLQTAAEQSTGIGLLIAVDQEGGRVNRLTDGVSVFPPAALLSGDTDAVREAGYLTGRQVLVQGINVVLAPVADISAAGAEGAIGNRSYGDDPEVVAAMVRAAIDGLQGAGVAAAVKHWPGHGATQVDSHEALPVLSLSREEWEARDLLPFQAAIDEDVDIVLVGHLALPSVDPAAEPASVSTVLINDLLRGQLGFDGVVMTDALNMSAVASYDDGDLAVQSVVAGVDILLAPPDLPASYNAVIAAVQDGTIPAERLDDAVVRVLALKEQLGLLPDA